MHSFHAYIDEAGDEGFKFGATRSTGSSEWFILSACVVRDTRLSAASRLLHSTLDPIEARRNAPVHFAKLPHETKVAVIDCIAHLPVRVICICINKRLLPAGHTLGSDRRLYRYAGRLLLERLSWVARDNSRPGQGNGKCRLVFSHCKGLSYPMFMSYFDRLQRRNDTQIEWAHVDTTRFKVLGHNQEVWLRAADACASGVAQSLELTDHGFTEERFVRTLQPRIYHNGINYRSYGMKFMPSIPTPEGGRANRYAWLALFNM